MGYASEITKFLSITRRNLWAKIDFSSAEYDWDERPIERGALAVPEGTQMPANSNGVSSMITTKEADELLRTHHLHGGIKSYHKLLLDIDHEAALIPSTTPGHYHLVIDFPIEEEDYFNVIDALAKAGIVEEGFAAAARRRKATWVRAPWERKPLPDETDDEVNF